MQQNRKGTYSDLLKASLTLRPYSHASEFVIHIVGIRTAGDRPMHNTFLNCHLSTRSFLTVRRSERETRDKRVGPVGTCLRLQGSN